MAQRVSEKIVLSFGEVLWDLLPDDEVLGGAPFNFAYRIQNLGYKSYMVSQVGKDSYGERAKEKIHQLGMPMEFIFESSEYPTGTVEVYLDENRNPDYKIIQDVAYDYITPTDELLETAGRASCLCFGTLAQRKATSKECLDQIINAFKGNLILCDINLRKECYTSDSIASSVERANVLKLNADEKAGIAEVFDIPSEEDEAFADAILRDGGLEACVITHGDKGVYAKNRKGESLFMPAYTISLVDPLGSGDAFAAGFIASLIEGQSLETACRLGNAMGALVASQKGGTQLLTLDDISRFIEANS